MWSSFSLTRFRGRRAAGLLLAAMLVLAGCQTGKDLGQDPRDIPLLPLPEDRPPDADETGQPLVAEIFLGPAPADFGDGLPPAYKPRGYQPPEYGPLPLPELPPEGALSAADGLFLPARPVPQAGEIALPLPLPPEDESDPPEDAPREPSGEISGGESLATDPESPLLTDALPAGAAPSQVSSVEAGRPGRSDESDGPERSDRPREESRPAPPPAVPPASDGSPRAPRVSSAPREESVPREPSPSREPQGSQEQGDREVAPGGLVVVLLPGRSWFYRESSPLLRLVRREGQGQQTRFTFQAPDSLEPGEEVVISFSMQDLRSGESLQEERRLRVVDSGGVSSGEDPFREMPIVETAGATDGDASRERLGREQREEPLPDGEQSGNNLPAGESAGEPAGSSQPEREREPSDRGLSDSELYQRARHYETPGPDRDLARARRLYAELLRDHPLSDHREDAKLRLEFLERHFFHLR